MATKQSPQANRKKKDHQYSSMPKSYSLLKEIREDALYKSNLGRRDGKARQIIEDYCESVNASKMMEGNVYSFEYFEPKTEEHLKYYDAMPCSFIFGKFKTKKGEPRILAFSLHYLPPRIRFQVLNKIMDIYQNIYQKNWKTGLGSDMSIWQYQMLLNILEKAKLSFAVHEYIPQLINKCKKVPPSLWHIAAFTEGRFKKQTREAVIRHWQNFKV